MLIELVFLISEVSEGRQGRHRRPQRRPVRLRHTHGIPSRLQPRGIPQQGLDLLCRALRHHRGPHAHQRNSQIQRLPSSSFYESGY